MLESNETALFRPAFVMPELHGHLQRDFHCCRAIVGVEDPMKWRRQDRCKPRGQFLGRFVRESGEDYLFQLPRLFRNCFGDQRVCMAVKIDPP